MLQPIQFQHGPNERDITVLLPQQLLCMRQTMDRLEFLREGSRASPCVISVEGLNLGALRREILNGGVTEVSPGRFGPSWSRCQVTHIRPRHTLSNGGQALAPDPNPTPDHCFQLETGACRDVWLRRHLEAIAVARGKAEQLLLQFRDQHAYVLTACPGTFPGVLGRMKKANFGFGMANQFSPFAHTVRIPALPATPRFVLQTVEHRPGNLADQSSWQVILDFRPGTQRQTVGIDL
jgi:hypothetical protein